MPSTLTQAHRVAQVRISGMTSIQVADLYGRIVDPTAVDSTVAAFIDAALPMVQRGYQQSAELAASYYGAQRAVALGPARYSTLVADALADEAVVTSLRVVGANYLKTATGRGVAVGRAFELAQTNVAGASSRHVQAGGRDTLMANVRADRRAQGWERVTSGNACDFCEMLAGRGAVYKEESTADFETHDHCSCTAEPVFG